MTEYMVRTRNQFTVAMTAWLFFICPVLADDVTIPFELPAGFSAEVLVEDVTNARSLALGDLDTLFVSTRRLGKLYAVTNAFSATPIVATIAADLDMPNGIAYFDGALYVVEARRIIRFPDIENRLDDPGKPEVIVDDLPFKSKLHAWKYIGFGPDRKLYVSLGAPCNVCEAPELAVVLRMNPDGSEREVFARGVRNSVGFDWHPKTGELWFTDNGRDMLGDEIPPGELNRAHEPGLDFGFPYCHGIDVADPKFGSTGRCDEFEPPVQLLGPHVAPLGMVFYTGEMFPKDYQRQVFIAEHGSWNRSKSAGKTGYRVTLVRLNGNEAVSYEPFMQGFLDAEQKVLGRPVDLLTAPDGALLVSDDQRGVIYRITYREDG
jgi:glucose/arabinose dehydrogenase